MIGIKELNEAPSTKISMNSNLVSNEQQGVELIFLDNIYVGDETSPDTQRSKAAWLKG